MKNYISNQLREYNYMFSEIESIYHEISVKMGLSDSVSNILYAICNSGGSIPLGDICRLTGVSKQTVNSALRKMEGEDLVYLEAINGKAKKVCLTEKGRELSGRTVLKVMKMEDSIYLSWPQEELDEYLRLTNRFLTSLKERVGTL